MPAKLAYRKTSGTTDDIVGIALNGVPIMRSLSELNYDAYFPIAYSTFKSPLSVATDACLGNNDYASFYHYYSFSPCIYPSTPKSATTASTCNSI